MDVPNAAQDAAYFFGQIEAMRQALECRVSPQPKEVVAKPKMYNTPNVRIPRDKYFLKVKSLSRLGV